jgi:hypothetical protein
MSTVAVTDQLLLIDSSSSGRSVVIGGLLNTIALCFAFLDVIAMSLLASLRIDALFRAECLGTEHDGLR